MATAVPRQDLPPTGGFAPIRYKRNLPKRGPPGFFYFLGGSLAIIFGLYKVGDGNHKNWCVRPCPMPRHGLSQSAHPELPKSIHSWPPKTGPLLASKGGSILFLFFPLLFRDPRCVALARAILAPSLHPL